MKQLVMKSKIGEVSGGHILRSLWHVQVLGIDPLQASLKKLLMFF